MKSYIICLVICCFAIESHAASASFIKRCKSNDTKCLVSSAQEALPYIANGNRKLGLPDIDPIQLGTIKIRAETFNLTLVNISTYGNSNCKFNNISRDTEEKVIKVDVDCPIRDVGKYILIGKVLGVDAFGNGDVDIQTDNLKFLITIYYKYIKRNGKKYFQITGFHYDFNLIKEVNFRLTNLFNGDTLRAAPFQQLLEKNGNLVAQEIARPVGQQYVARGLNSVNKIFQEIPADQLELS